jgi:hypothetical protein
MALEGRARATDTDIASTMTPFHSKPFEVTIPLPLGCHGPRQSDRQVAGFLVGRTCGHFPRLFFDLNLEIPPQVVPGTSVQLAFYFLFFCDLLF